MKGKMKIWIGTLLAVCCISTSSAAPYVGVPGSGTMEDQESDGADGITYDPESYTGMDESSDTNKENMDLLEHLHDSWDEDPGGSSYTEEAAYYKVGSLSEKPELSAPSSILIDASSGVVLYNKNASEKKFPASITKVMTALIAIENGNLDDDVEYKASAVNEIPSDATKAGFSVGDKATLRESLYALFMSSAADSAVAIAEKIGGSVDQFVEMMNTKAQTLGCANTKFTNPHGMHDENHYTTAHDMALIMQCAVGYPDFCEIIEAKSYTIPKSDHMKSEIKLSNKSALLSEGNENYYEYAKGSKTGHTDAAKYTLASYAEKDGGKLISIVMDGESYENCYCDTKRMFEWGYGKTQTLFPLPQGDTEIGDMLKASMSDEKYEWLHRLDLQYMPDYGIITNRAINTDAIDCFFVMDEDMENGVLGYLNITYYNKILIGKTPVLYDTDTEGYREYISHYNKQEDEEPIIIVPNGTEEPMEESSEWNESSLPNSLIEADMMDKGIQAVIFYGLGSITLCLVAYIIILIRRKKGY